MFYGLHDYKLLRLMFHVMYMMIVTCSERWCLLTLDVRLCTPHVQCSFRIIILGVSYEITRLIRSVPMSTRYYWFKVLPNGKLTNHLAELVVGSLLDIFLYLPFFYV